LYPGAAHQQGARDLAVGATGGRLADRLQLGASCCSSRWRTFALAPSRTVLVTAPLRSSSSLGVDCLQDDLAERVTASFVGLGVRLAEHEGSPADRMGLGSRRRHREGPVPGLSHRRPRHGADADGQAVALRARVAGRVLAHVVVVAVLRSRCRSSAFGGVRYITRSLDRQRDGRRRACAWRWTVFWSWGVRRASFRTGVGRYPPFWGSCRQMIG
jgi:hypothetical protein